MFNQLFILSAILFIVKSAPTSLSPNKSSDGNVIVELGGAFDGAIFGSRLREVSLEKSNDSVVAASEKFLQAWAKNLDGSYGDGKITYDCQKTSAYIRVTSGEGTLEFSPLISQKGGKCTLEVKVGSEEKKVSIPEKWFQNAKKVSE